MFDPGNIAFDFNPKVRLADPGKTACAYNRPFLALETMHFWL
jgi:hypothetical protein